MNQLLDTMTGVIAGTVTPAEANKVVAKSRKARVKHSIRTEKQRQKLAPRTAPYYETLAPGHQIGWRAYRAGMGCWVGKNGSVRSFPHTGRLSYQDGLSLVLDHFAQADAPKESITVETAITNYVADLRKRKGLAAEVSTRKRLDLHCKSLMQIAVIDLTSETLRAWMNGLPGTASTVNRVRAMLIASLNLTDCDPAAWRKLKALPTGDTAKKLLLTSEEISRLLSVTSGAFHNLLKAASLTGARLGELRNLTVADLDNGMLSLSGKTGARITPLRSDALEFFGNLCATAHNLDAPLLPADDGRAWKSGKHSTLMVKAVREANIDSQATFYSIRHFVISSMVRDRLPILAVAQYCGTSVEMISKHYGHFAKNEMLDMLNSVAL